MPTTHDEADKIAHILTDYLSPEKAGALIERLFQEVGLVTDNYSVRSSIFMLKRMFCHDLAKELDRDFVMKLEKEWSDEQSDSHHKLDWIGITEREYNAVIGI